MKKWLTALLSVLLVAAMMISFAACAGEDKDDDDGDEGKTTVTTVIPAGNTDPEPTLDEKIIGDWELTLDIMEIAEKSAELENADSLDGLEGIGEMAAMLEDVEFEIVLIMSFNEDKTVEMTVDEDALKETMGILFDAIMEMAVESQDMTLDEYYELLESQGMTRDQLIEQAFAEVDFSEMEQAGTYRLDGNKLYIDTESDEDSDDYIEISIDGDKLSIDAVSGVEEDEKELADILLPLVLNKK